jgi:uncharacterized protein (DUF2147 family)
MRNLKAVHNLKTALVALLAASIASAASAGDPYGTWERPSTGTQVSFYDCGGKLCAKIIAVKDPHKKDTIGKVIMPGATKSSENQWKGDLLNTEDGKTYSGVVTLEDPNALNLKGCAFVGLICKGETWVKVN